MRDYYLMPTGAGEESGKKAADAGFDVKVSEDAVLTGGITTSIQKAVDEGRNCYQVTDAQMLKDMFTKTLDQRYHESSRIGRIAYWIFIAIVFSLIAGGWLYGILRH